MTKKKDHAALTDGLCGSLLILSQSCCLKFSYLCFSGRPDFQKQPKWNTGTTNNNICFATSQYCLMKMTLGIQWEWKANLLSNKTWAMIWDMKLLSNQIKLKKRLTITTHLNLHTNTNHLPWNPNRLLNFNLTKPRIGWNLKAVVILRTQI